jgi:hypothetical protein
VGIGFRLFSYTFTDEKLKFLQSCPTALLKGVFALQKYRFTGGRAYLPLSCLYNVYKNVFLVKAEVYLEKVCRTL